MDGKGAMRLQGIFKGWVPQRGFGFIRPDDKSADVFLHSSQVQNWWEVRAGARLEFQPQATAQGRSATAVSLLQARPNQADKQPSQKSNEDAAEKTFEDEALVSEDIEQLETEQVASDLLKEVSRWKREAKAEDSGRYFWHVSEVDRISRGESYFVIGRKGSGKTAICEYFNNIKEHDVFAEKLSFKNFPFNELYSHKNSKYTSPNQFITIWKYLIYSSVCRLMLKNEALNNELRQILGRLYSDDTSLSRRIGKWVGKEFGISLFGLTGKWAKDGATKELTDWVQYVDYLEDLLSQYAGDATYYILFDELDEDYRDIISEEQYEQYTALITSLFKAVQDVRTVFDKAGTHRVYPIIFLRDDIYDIVKDSDKNKWGDFKVDLNWDNNKIKNLLAFRISRALDAGCKDVLDFDTAWAKLFGVKPIGFGRAQKKRVSTFDFISRSTLLRPRDFVFYLQACAQQALENRERITPHVVRHVDKAFSNYLKQELVDELFAILPDVENIFDAISQLRKWNFSIRELERGYAAQLEQGYIQEKNVKFVLQVLFLFSVIGNTPRVGRYIFRYQNREARLNFNERVVVHRGLFKALQIL